MSNEFNIHRSSLYRGQDFNIRVATKTADWTGAQAYIVLVSPLGTRYQVTGTIAPAAPDDPDGFTFFAEFLVLGSNTASWELGMNYSAVIWIVPGTGSRKVPYSFLLNVTDAPGGVPT